MYYTVDGSDPLTSSTRGTVSSFMGMSVIFGMSGTATVKMVAVKDGYQPSDVETYQYFIRVGTPVAFPGDGEWKELSDTVKLSSTTPGATIYYTLDGSQPTRQSAKYTGPITLTKGQTNVIKAFAVKDDSSPDSFVVTYEFKENPNLILLTEVLNTNASADYVIDKVISEMTLDEKVRMVWGAGTSQLGAAGNTYAIPRLGITSMELADGPAGLRLGSLGAAGSHEATAWPNPMMLASTWNTSVLAKIGEAIGTEANYYGVDIMLGPGMNIHRDPLGGRVFEYYSEDPYLTGKLAASWIKGLQENGVGATMKHYAANNAENNRMNINEIISERALREIYLKGYEIATKEADPWAAMSAYVKINGTYCSEDEYLNKMLKDVFGFKGLIMSDWGAYHSPNGYKTGFDLNTPGGSGADSLKDAIAQGIITEKDLDRAIESILNIVIKTNTFKKQIYDKSEYAAKTKLDSNIAKQHAALSKEAALEGIVLLKNDGKTLPLKNIKTVALMGKLAYLSSPADLAKGIYFEGGGSAAVVVDLNEVVSLVDALSSGGLNVVQKTQDGKYLAEGMSTNDALYAANNSDAAVILIGRPGSEGSDNPASNMKLTDEELGLIKNASDAYHSLGKKVIVLLNVAHPIEVDNWDDYVDAVLYIGLPGTYGASAVTDILLGKVNPSGKLVDTWPLEYDYAPTDGNMPTPTTTEMTYTEDIYVGYRYYDLHPEVVKYPFGYGLSYTQFAYKSLTLNKNTLDLSKDGDKIMVTVTVKNVGDVAGKEVVELYVKANDSKVERPYKELKGFAKTVLLNPGAEQKVTFILDKSAFEYFDEVVHEWVVEQGTYTIMIGGTSDNTVLEQSGVSAEVLVTRK
ncbi:MAG TPA: glycoside hydrolase family 3 C-terminal domain-containing protein [Fervidobacterium sp.]|nr:glycoside hydrolase family 3 C-terminal domain-containing protein [Fervidobacterium sp.]